MDDIFENPPEGMVPLGLVLQPQGEKLEICRPEVVIGRHSEADVRLAFPEISRRHCLCRFRDGDWHILDLNSFNGVFVNGQRIHEAVLEDGDRLHLGHVELIVCLPGSHRIFSLPARSAPTVKIPTPNKPGRKAS